MRRGRSSVGLLLLNTTRRNEILEVLGVNIDPAKIAARPMERIRNVAALLDGQNVEDQRKVLFASCRRVVADAETRQIVI